MTNVSFPYIATGAFVVSRHFLPVITFLVAIPMSEESVSVVILAALIMISFGPPMMMERHTWSENHWRDYKGLALLASGLICQSLHFILVKRLAVKYSPAEAMVILSPIIAAFLAPDALISEGPPLVSWIYSRAHENVPFWSSFLLSFPLSFAVVYLSMDIAMRTSALTLNVLRNVRVVCSVILGMVFLGKWRELSPLVLCGFGLFGIGLALYWSLRGGQQAKNRRGYDNVQHTHPDTIGLELEHFDDDKV